MRDGFRNALITVLVLVISAACVYGGIRWNATVNKWEKEAEREVFKETTTYNEAAVSFLADSYKEYNNAETDEDKAAIMSYVIMRYPNLDVDNIDNKTLKQFYKDCLEN